jgi:hypothetical protein
MIEVTDEMIEAAIQAFDDHSSISISNYRDDMRVAIEAAIQAAWVSVDDSLPEYGLVVLNQNGNKVRCRNGVWSMLVIHGERNFLGELSSPSEQWYHCDDGEVTHWMPLPEFKEGSDESN